MSSQPSPAPGPSRAAQRNSSRHSHGTTLDYVRKVPRDNAIGGKHRHTGSREEGRMTVTDAAGRVLIDYEWMTLTAEELEEAQE